MQRVPTITHIKPGFGVTLTFVRTAMDTTNPTASQPTCSHFRNPCLLLQQKPVVRKELQFSAALELVEVEDGGDFVTVMVPGKGAAGGRLSSINIGQ